MLIFTSEPTTVGAITTPDVKEFENYLSNLLEGNRLVRTNSQTSKNSVTSPQKGTYSEKDME